MAVFGYASRSANTPRRAKSRRDGKAAAAERVTKPATRVSRRRPPIRRALLRPSGR